MNSNKHLINEDQGVQYIYERAEVEAAPRGKPIQKALLTLGFLGVFAGASTAVIGHFSNAAGQSAIAEQQVVNTAAAGGAQSGNSAQTASSSAAGSTSSQAAKITLPTPPKSYGSVSHATQKSGKTANGSIAFAGENEGEED